MKNRFIYTFLAFLLSIQNFAQEKESEFGVKFSGFVSAEAFFDTRDVVSAREDDVILYPKNKEFDFNGDDINDRMSFNFSAIHSRLGAGITGPTAFGAKTSGLLQFDFVGQSNSLINMIRMRHAFIKLSWENTSLLLGQYWHPMFVAECYPGVASWGASLPVSVLGRAPQIRLTHNLSSNFFVMAALLTQRDFKSMGPDGESSQYLTDSGIPEVQGQFGFNNETFTSGIVFGYKTIVPRVKTTIDNINFYKTDESIGSYNLGVYLKLTTQPVTVKLMGYYGQNFTNYVMLGGYAESSIPDPVTGAVEYTNYKTSSVWTEIHTNGKEIQYGLFAGITNNLGTDDEIIGAVYTRGSDIAYVYRIAPRVTWFSNSFSVTLEAFYTTAAYGTPDNFGKVQDTEEVASLRTLISCKYNF